MSLSTRLFVGNLPDSYNEDALREAFSAYGVITNFDVKCKPTPENDKKIFAFISLSASNYNVESCIQHFAEENFCGHRLYVTRARESFLERLKRERDQSSKINTETVNIQEDLNIKKNPLIDTLKSHKRKLDTETHIVEAKPKNTKYSKVYEEANVSQNDNDQFSSNIGNKINKDEEKKHKADEKRLESIKRKRQEFNEKKRIIKTGLTSIDKQVNKKVIFSDTEDEICKSQSTHLQKKKIVKDKVDLFDGYESDHNTNFEIKEQYEGKKGQKILELQSKYKSDKRFILDERFVEEEKSEDDEVEQQDNQEVELGQADERSKQMSILQNVLGVPIKSRNHDVNNKIKSKPGMLRFDPAQSEHAKFLAPVEVKQDAAKKSKKKKSTKDELDGEYQEQPLPVEKVEVSKDQFYKISDSLKETISQPKEFSLRSLFTKNDIDIENAEGTKEAEVFIPSLSRKDKKVVNPLDPGEKNPFVYDSTDSENEDDSKNQNITMPEIEKEQKSVWKEKLFFTNADNRLKDGLQFFCKVQDKEGHKDRRELKSLMKKRTYNKDRKNYMFQKKIGGRKKTMKKSFRKKS